MTFPDLARAGRSTVVVAGMLAGDPFHGGATWAVLQWVLGLRQLGCDVVVVDPLDGAPAAGTLSYFRSVARRFGLEGRAALVGADGTVHGMTAADLDDAVARAAVLLNLSGRWRDHERVAAVPVRAFVDLDPAFTQLWHADGHDLGIADHTHHLTVGAGVAAGTSTVPDLGVSWTAVLPPVVLDEWPLGPHGVPDPMLTTVANWRSYGSIEHGGVHYGQKAHSFRRLLDVAARSPVPAAVALDIHEGDRADRDALAAAGWRLLDPFESAGDPDRYRRFVQSSWAEIGVAKSGYVAGRSGWVSDRSACYLAAGRPVILQDTGLDDVLPLGSGVLTFEDGDDVIAAVHDIARRYDEHRTAARRVAERMLDARIVLGRVLRDVGVTLPSSSLAARPVRPSTSARSMGAGASRRAAPDDVPVGRLEDEPVHVAPEDGGDGVEVHGGALLGEVRVATTGTPPPDARFSAWIARRVSAAGARRAPIRERFAGSTDADWLAAHLDGAPGLPPLPAESVRLHRHGTAGPRALEDGFAVYRAIRELAATAGVDLCDPGTTVLDFGCGWGRVLRFFAREVPPPRLHGIDVADELIALCRRGDPLGTFHRNDHDPPIDAPDGAFSLVYAWSVFSHLSEPAHLAWLSELRRVTRPGGLVVLSVRRRRFIRDLAELRRRPESARYPGLRGVFTDTDAVLARYDAGGYCFEPYTAARRDWGEACIPRSYIARTWRRSFELLDIAPAQPLDQDLVVMRRTASAAN